MHDSQDLLPRESDKIAEDEIAYQKYVKRKIEEGIKAADDGRIVSHDEVRQILAL